MDKASKDRASFGQLPFSRYFAIPLHTVTVFPDESSVIRSLEHDFNKSVK
jgi:hypothetical protein